MDAYRFELFGVAVAAPWWWYAAALAWMALAGVVLWLLGRRLIRPLFALVGLAGGAVVALWLLARYAPDIAPLGWVIAGAVVGALVLGFLLWRIALALVATAVAVVLVPGAVILATPMDAPAVWEPIVEARDQALEAMNTPAPDEGGEGEAEGARDTADAEGSGGGRGAGNEAEDDLPSATEPLVEGWANAAEAFNGWWDELPTSRKGWLVIAAVGGGLLALLVGLGLPQFTAALLTALSGSLLVLPGIDRVIDFLPTSAAEAISMPPLLVALALLVSTIVGALVQWLLFRRPSEK